MDSPCTGEGHVRVGAAPEQVARRRRRVLKSLGLQNVARFRKGREVNNSLETTGFTPRLSRAGTRTGTHKSKQ